MSDAMLMTQEERDKTPCFVATCPACQRVVAAAVDTPDHVRDTAKAVASWIRDGLTLTKMLPPEVRAANWGHSKGCAARKRKAAK